MRAKIWSDLLKALAVFGLLFGGIWFGLSWWSSASLGEFFRTDPAPLVSVSDEISIGDFLARQVELQYATVDHVPELDLALDSISQRLLDALGETPYPYKFTVIEGSEINAFALPGGHVFIFTGLLHTVENAEELAAVLAHEMGHIERRHTVKKLLKEVGIAVLASIALGGEALPAEELLTGLLSTRFDRRYESQADEFSLDLLLSASLSPRHMAEVFRKFDASASDYDEYFEMLSTHPHNKSRIERADAFPIPPSFVERPLPLDWAHVRHALEDL